MNAQSASYLHDVFDTVKEARIPDHVQAIVKFGVGNTRASYDTITVCSRESAKALEQVIVAAQAGAKTVGEKILQNCEANTEAIFHTAHAMARAKTLSELAHLQRSFVAQQFAIAGAQAKELAELSAKVAQQTMESVNIAVTEQLKTVAVSGERSGLVAQV